MPIKRSIRSADEPVTDGDGPGTGRYLAGCSRQNPFNGVRLSFSAGKLLVQALETIGKSIVVDTHQIENSRINVSDMNRIPHDIVAEIVGFTVDSSALDARAGHPHRITTRMMVPPIVVSSQFAL